MNQIVAGRRAPTLNVPRVEIVGKAPVFACPCCTDKGIARQMEVMSALTRKIYYRCDNDLCGHRWTATLEFTASTTPSNFGPGRIPEPMIKQRDRLPDALR